MKEFFAKVRALRRTHRSERRRWPAVIALLVLLGAGCGVLCAAAVKSAESSLTSAMVLGVVDKDKSMVSQMATGIATSHQQLTTLFSVVEYPDEQQAVDAVLRGDAVGALILEEGYFNRIRRGESEAVSVILNEQLQTHADIIRAFGGTAERLIKTGEYGSNAAWQPFNQQWGDRTASKFSVFSLQYVMELLAVTAQSIQMEQLGYSDTAGSLAGHYVLQYIVLLLALSDMALFDFVRREGDRDLLCRLRCAGLGGLHLFAAKLPRVLAVKAGVLLAATVAAGVGGLLQVSAAGVASAAAGLIFMSVTGVALCALLQRSNIGPCLLCAVALAGLFLCGGLVPYDLLPRAVTDAGILTPHGMAAATLSPLFGGAVRPEAYLLAAGLGGASVWAACRYWRALCAKGGDAV